MRDGEIKVLNIIETYKYLSVEIGARLKYSTIAEKNSKRLTFHITCPSETTSAALILIYILRTHLIPSLVLHLSFEKISLKSLNAADVAIRKATRRWLKLPKDTPNAFLHAPVRLGGLGIFQLRKWIPSMWTRRISQVLKQAKENKDQFMLDVLGGGTAVTEEVKRFGIPEARNKTLGKATATALYKTVDGYRLRSQFPNAIGPSEWLTDGIDRMASDQWLKCAKVSRSLTKQTARIKIQAIY